MRIINKQSGTSVPTTYAKDNCAHHVITGTWTGIALESLEANDWSHGDLRSTSPSNHQCWLSYWGTFRSDACNMHRKAVVISFETKTPRLSRTWWATSERRFQNRCRPDNVIMQRPTWVNRIHKLAHTHKHLPPNTSKETRWNKHENMRLTKKQIARFSLKFFFHCPWFFLHLPLTIQA